METQAGKSTQLAVWVAAILLIVVSGTGVAVMMGWIPVSLGRPEVPGLAKLEQPAAAVVIAAPCTGCGVVQSVREVTIKKSTVKKRVKPERSYEVTVDLDDGTNRVITEDSEPAWRNGDKVRIVNGIIESNA